jgi:hypothetical protein
VELLLYIRTVVKSYILTAVDLSDRTDRATSFASQVLESFVFKNVEFIGPTETDTTMLFFRSRRSETIRCRASGERGAADEYRSGFLDSTHERLRDFLPGLRG